jgi:protein TonB
MGGSVHAMPASPPPGDARGARDPLTIILGDGERWDLFTIAMAVAVALHMGLLLFAIITGLLKDMHLAVAEDRARLHDYFWRQYEVEVVKPKDEPKPEPPPPEPPPDPTPAPKMAVKPVDDDPYKNAAPVPAKATAVLTQKEKLDEPVDLTKDGFVSGDGNAVGGMQSANGKGDQVTMAKHASNDGVPGGTGKVPAAQAVAPPPGEDKSRGVALSGGTSWNCPFPPEADAEQIDQAVVGVQVTVRADGSASAAAVVSDPGHGFGRAAKSCALARRYQPALNRAGEPIPGGSLVNVRFSR